MRAPSRAAAGGARMQLERGFTSIEAPGGALPCYGSRPARARDPLPGVIVIQEGWGVDEHVEDVADRLATPGYQAPAPQPYPPRGPPPPPPPPQPGARPKRPAP